MVQATVTFSHRLDVTGSPRLGLRFVSGDRSVWKEAAYDSGDGSNELVFEYRVSPGDAAGDGVGVYYDGLLKNGVTLRVAGTQVDAETPCPSWPKAPTTWLTASFASPGPPSPPTPVPTSPITWAIR